MSSPFRPRSRWGTPFPWCPLHCIVSPPVLIIVDRIAYIPAKEGEEGVPQQEGEGPLRRNRRHRDERHRGAPPEPGIRRERIGPQGERDHPPPGSAGREGGARPPRGERRPRRRRGGDLQRGPPLEQPRGAGRPRPRH